MTKTIACVGEALWDIFPDGERPGGAPANFAYHARNLGADTRLYSAVGRDVLGDRLVLHYEEQRLPTEWIARVDHPTGTVTVEMREDRGHTFVIHENVAWDHIPWSEDLRQWAASADAVYFGSLAQRAEESRTTIRQALDEAGDAAWRVFDINLRQKFWSRELLRESIDRATALKLNDDELPVAAEIYGVSIDDPVKALPRLGEAARLKSIALTLGAEGCAMWRRGDEIASAQAPPTQVADTVGAGDSFCAAWVVGLLNRDPLDQVAHSAVELAAHVVRHDGAMPPPPGSHN